MLLLTDTQQCALSVSFVDSKGHPAKVDGAPTWTSSDATVCAITAGADGFSALAVAGAPGTATVSVTADADLGAGVTPISAVLDVTVSPGSAVAANIATGTPEEQPPA